MRQPSDSQMFFQTRQFQKKNAGLSELCTEISRKKTGHPGIRSGLANRMIKEPLMQLAASEPNAFYITFNKGELYIPDEIQGKSIGVDGGYRGGAA